MTNTQILEKSLIYISSQTSPLNSRIILHLQLHFLSKMLSLSLEPPNFSTLKLATLQPLATQTWSNRKDGINFHSFLFCRYHIQPSGNPIQIENLNIDTLTSNIKRIWPPLTTATANPLVQATIISHLGYYSDIYQLASLLPPLPQ